MLPLCLSEGAGANPWSPLARGRLTRPSSDEPTTERAKPTPLGERCSEEPRLSTSLSSTV